MSKLTQTLKRWYRNIDWLLNHPPVSLTNPTEKLTCDYCGGSEGNCRQWCNDDGPIFTICHGCTKEVFDRVLKHRDG